MSETSPGRLIRGGTVVDGTGAPAFRADVRIRDGVITDVAPGLEAAPGELVIDASGCHVAPGFIESHTHFDGTMWWQPDLDPLPGYGVTTVVMGNCGFALAPLPDDAAARAEVVKIFSFFEDIPERPFFENLPWDWKSWSEYKASLTKRVAVPTHYATFVGHIAIRLAAMGMDAWQRAATAAEIERMARRSRGRARGRRPRPLDQSDGPRRHRPAGADAASPTTPSCGRSSRCWRDIRAPRSRS